MACDRSAITWLTASASANGPGMRKTRAPQLVVRAWDPGLPLVPRSAVTGWRNAHMPSGTPWASKSAFSASRPNAISFG
jgi:hypothetical protein